MKRLAPAARRFGNFDAVRAFRGDPDDTADGPVTQVLFRNGRQVAWRAGQLLPAQETAVVGQDCVDARKIARGRHLGVFEGQPFIAEGSGEHLLGQRQDPQKPHEFGGQEAFAPASSRTWFRSMVADHSEGGGAYMASDGPGFGEGQGTCRRHGVLSLEEDVEQHVRIEQHAERFAVPKTGFEVRRRRAARCAGLPAPK